MFVCANVISVFEFYNSLHNKNNIFFKTWKIKVMSWGYYIKEVQIHRMHIRLRGNHTIFTIRIEGAANNIVQGSCSSFREKIPVTLQVIRYPLKILGIKSRHTICIPSFEQVLKQLIANSNKDIRRNWIWYVVECIFFIFIFLLLIMS